MSIHSEPGSDYGSIGPFLIVIIMGIMVFSTLASMHNSRDNLSYSEPYTITGLGDCVKPTCVYYSDDVIIRSKDSAVVGMRMVKRYDGGEFVDWIKYENWMQTDREELGRSQRF